MEDQDFIRDEQLEIIVNDLIAVEPELIYLKAGRVGVVCLRSDKCKKKDGIPVFADCEEVPEKVQMGHRSNVYDNSFLAEYFLL